MPQNNGVVMSFFHILAAWLVLLALPVSASAKATAAEFDVDRNRLIAYMLSHQLASQHFAHKSLDAVSPAAFDLYLRQIDPRKRFLLLEDVEQLRSHADRIGDELRRGRVELADRGAELLNLRIDEVEAMAAALLDAGFDPHGEDSLELDPRKIHYAVSTAELRDRWRRILKLQALETYLDFLEQGKNNGAAQTEKKKEQPAASPADEPLNTELWSRAVDKVRERNKRAFHRLRQETRQDHYNLFFDAVARAFDPHSNYMPPSSKEDFDIHMSGSLEGIGALLREDDGFIKIVRIIPGSAAERQGELQAEDIILSVAEKDGEPVDISDMRIREAVSHIRGPKGSEVLLTVQKPDSSKKTISIIRDVVQIEETYVKSEIADGEHKIGYIRIPSFYRDFAAAGPMSQSRNSTNDFRRELWNLRQNTIGGLILDLRDNGGGSLSDAVDITGMFLPGGPVVQVKNAQGEIKVLEDADANILYDGPIIVLVNKFSASASEILAAALQDYNRALIIGGDHTHGKGTVQSIVDLNRNLPLLHRKKYDDLGALKMTIQKFYRINGESTQYKGVEPDVVVPTMLDYLKSGEKHLDYSLPWNMLEAVPFRPWTRNPFDVDRVRELSNAWTFASPEFAKIRERVEKARERSEQTRIPVSLEGVRKERLELAALSEREEEKPESLDSLLPDHGTPPDRDIPLREQLQKDPYVQLAVYIMNELALSNE
ncbi:MAG TPA: tail-specific protease [Desulfobacteraceae bacterium]|nr:tail-specific protease [Desulfobacteraceae bacterium]